MARIVVTNGAGFVGSHLVDALVKRGDEVIVLDNLTSGRLANIADAIATGRVTFVYSDIPVTSGALRSIVERVGAPSKLDAIFHFAGSAGGAARGTKLWDGLAESANATSALVEIAVESNAQFIYVSESSWFENLALVGEGPGLHVEDNATFVDAERFAGQDAVAAAKREMRLDARIVRVRDCYGPRMTLPAGHFIAALFDAAYERRAFTVFDDDTQNASMTYIGDAIDALMSIAGQDTSPGFPVDIIDDGEHSIIDIAQTLAAAVSVAFHVQFVPLAQYGRRERLTGGLSAQNSGWTPKTSLPRGLRLTYNWYAKESRVFV